MINVKDYLPRTSEEIEFAMERFAWNYFIKTDLRWLHLQHPNKQEVNLACLHFLGDEVQKFWEEVEDKRTQFAKLCYVLNQIKKSGIEFSVGGSFSLFVWDIIDRKINDLDIIVKRQEDLKYFSENYEESFEKYHEESTLSGEVVIEDIGDLLDNPFTLKKIKYISKQKRVKINDINVCVFYSEEEENAEYFDLVHLDEPIKVADPKYAILAKKNYLTGFGDIAKISHWDESKILRYVKHISDIMCYNKWTEKNDKEKF